MEWLVNVDGQQYGPLPEAQVADWIRSGRLKSFHRVWHPGLTEWYVVGAVPNLAAHLPHIVQANQGAHDPMTRMMLPVDRSVWAIAAGYLGLFSPLFIFAPFALICGILAIREIRGNPKVFGMGRAIFGIVMGSVFTLGAIVFLVAAFLAEP